MPVVETSVKRTSLASLGALWIVLVLAVPAQAQLAYSRLEFSPVRVGFGPGTVRLDGMGGFEVSVQDENNEINLNDYIGNPAGFGDDRDAWSLDTRYTHREGIDRSNLLSGDDVRINDGSFLAGYYNPGVFGLGAVINYGEAETRNNPFDTNEQFKLAGGEVRGNYYPWKWMSLGIGLGFGGEDQDLFTDDLYRINHSASEFRGELGVAVKPVRGITLGLLGQIENQTIDGDSRDGFHTDTFDWTRSGGFVSAHALVNRGRVDGAIEYRRGERSGEEIGNLSWSTRFLLNPSLDTRNVEVRTFTENRESDIFRTRWMLKIVPETFNFGISYEGVSDTSRVIANPNEMGSLQDLDAQVSRDIVTAGVSWIGVERRLMVAAEIQGGRLEVSQYRPDGRSLFRQDQILGRVGAEFLLGEVLVLRGGYTRAEDELDLPTGEEMDNGIYTTSTLHTGIGIVPSGGIWQFDFAFDLDIDNDLDGDRERFSAYLKYLF